MLKKLVIAAVAVVVGLVVLTKVTNVSLKTWFGDCCRSARNMVPPEVQLKQLRVDIKNIDNDISKNLSDLAHMKTDLDAYTEALAQARNKMAHLRTDVHDMRKSLKQGDEQVVYRGRKKDADDVTRELDITVTRYSCLKEKVKTQEKVLAEKKKALKTAETRVQNMQTEKERLLLVAEQLQSELEMLKLKQAENQTASFDDSALSRAQQTAKDVKTRLSDIRNLIEYQKKFGRIEKIEPTPEPSKEEVLKRAEAIDQDDKPANSVAVGKDKDE